MNSEWSRDSEPNMNSEWSHDSESSTNFDLGSAVGIALALGILGSIVGALASVAHLAVESVIDLHIYLDMIYMRSWFGFDFYQPP